MERTYDPRAVDTTVQYLGGGAYTATTCVRCPDGVTYTRSRTAYDRNRAERKARLWLHLDLADRGRTPVTISEQVTS